MEHDGQATTKAPGVSRRQFLGLLAASAAAEAMACRRAVQEPIVPYVKRPPDVHPDAVTVYATSFVLDAHATGLLVSCRDGRPIKVDGNPDHPASLGATGPIEQAAVLQLYDPDRARALKLRSAAASWSGLVRVLAGVRGRDGDGLRLLLPPTSSPSLADLMVRVCAACPGARFAFHSAVASGHTRAGARLAFGQPLEPIYDVGRADVVVALDADLLAQGPFSLRYAREWSRRRDPDRGPMIRLYCAETMVSVTGSVADHRLPVRPSEVGRVMLQLAAELQRRLGPGALPSALEAVLQRWHSDDPWVRCAAADLAGAKGRGLLVVGDRQPALLHALAHVLNQALGNQGQTVTTVPPAVVEPAEAMTLAELAADMQQGGVSTLVIVEGNPAYDAPADLDFATLLRRVPTSIYLGAYENETSEAVQWFVPAAHPFESWGDARALDGTLSLQQPLVSTMHGERSPLELLAALVGPEPARPRDLVRASVERRGHGPDLWRESLRLGVVAGTVAAPVDLPIDVAAVAAATADAAATFAARSGTEINFLPDPGVYDGRFANNGWLLELPRPISALSWSNAAYLGPEMAHALNLKSGEVVELELAGRRVRVPAFVLTGHAGDAVTLHLGFGRRGAEHLARNQGANANLLRIGGAHFQSGLAVRPTGETKALALAQLAHEQHGRPVALQLDLDVYRARPDQLADYRSPQPSLYPVRSKGGDQWAMSIDLGQCIGCGACVVACQAENNVPVVGEAEVRRGRAMHWLRIDSYIEAPSTHRRLRIVHQPMACQHCEDAPCEYVCPVNATVHSPDGLNEMVYNRCVGTRFCSNNCPYKVRRFNWFNWYKREPANQGSVRLQRNPEVTVRDRGVMEKCTYCVQRIRNAQIQARIEQRELGPDEVRTACQQACPTRAIAFGSLAHHETEMVKRRRSERAYEVLHTQGTRPRTWYLARIDNPNPSLADP